MNTKRMQTTSKSSQVSTGSRPAGERVCAAALSLACGLFFLATDAAQGQGRPPLRPPPRHAPPPPHRPELPGRRARPEPRPELPTAPPENTYVAPLANARPLAENHNQAGNS